MPHFIVNDNAQFDSGDHEVHQKYSGCTQMPDAQNQRDLGEFNDCHGAVAEAKKTYPQSNGCAYCCPACNTG